MEATFQLNDFGLWIWLKTPCFLNGVSNSKVSSNKTLWLCLELELTWPRGPWLQKVKKAFVWRVEVEAPQKLKLKLPKILHLSRWVLSPNTFRNGVSRPDSPCIGYILRDFSGCLAMFQGVATGTIKLLGIQNSNCIRWPMNPQTSPRRKLHRNWMFFVLELLFPFKIEQKGGFFLLSWQWFQLATSTTYSSQYMKNRVKAWYDHGDWPPFVLPAKQHCQENLRAAKVAAMAQKIGQDIPKPAKDRTSCTSRNKIWEGQNGMLIEKSIPFLKYGLFWRIPLHNYFLVPTSAVPTCHNSPRSKNLRYWV